MHKLKSLGVEFYGCKTTRATLFSALKSLNILECLALIEWKEVVVVMSLPTDEKVALVVTVSPCLEQLALSSCTELRNAPAHSPSLQK